MCAGRSADSDVRARGCVCVCACVCEVGGLVGCVVHHVDHPGDGRPVIGLPCRWNVRRAAGVRVGALDTSRRFAEASTHAHVSLADRSSTPCIQCVTR